MSVRDYFWGLPALLVGVLAMVAGDVGAARAAANVVFFVLGLLLVVRARRVSWRPGLPTAGALAGLLCVTLLMPGSDGVRRWIDAGPLSLNVSMLVAPLLLVVVARLLAAGRTPAAIAVAVGVQVVHLLQPDAAQGAAFAAGAIVLLLLGARRQRAMRFSGGAGLLALAIATFARADPLKPVPEVEGIVGLARDAAPALGVAAVLTCALLLTPFVRAASLSRSGQAGLCAYVVVQLLAPIALHVPVPVMGYGAGTVLAYAAAVSASLLMPPATRTLSARGAGTRRTRRRRRVAGARV